MSAKRIRPRYRTAPLALFVAATLLAIGTGACGSQTSSSCGEPYVLKVGAREFSGGSCAGQIANASSAIDVHRRAKFSISIVHLKDGALVVPLPAPGNNDVELLSLSDGVATYLATHKGTVKLAADRTKECPAANARACTPFIIRVVPSP